MRLGKIHKKSEKSFSRQPVIEGIQTKWILWKKKWAAWMGSKYNRLPLAHKIITLGCFVALVGGYSIFLIVSSVREKSLGHHISHISVPRHIKPIEQRPGPNYAIQSKEYQRIHRFRIYMDSLSKDPTGHIFYDSIIRRYPGLMDSVYRVDNNFSNRGYDKNQ